jgi:hypothetical protein
MFPERFEDGIDGIRFFTPYPMATSSTISVLSKMSTLYLGIVHLTVDLLFLIALASKRHLRNDVMISSEDSLVPRVLLTCSTVTKIFDSSKLGE